MKLSKQYAISLFINNFGKLSKQYDNLKSDVEKYEFLVRNFGRIGIDVLYARQSTQRIGLPFGWISHINNFLINLIDWHV